MPLLVAHPAAPDDDGLHGVLAGEAEQHVAGAALAREEADVELTCVGGARLGRVWIIIVKRGGGGIYATNLGSNKFLLRFCQDSLCVDSNLLVQLLGNSFDSSCMNLC